jgi:signal transduction histidine kinase
MTSTAPRLAGGPGPLPPARGFRSLLPRPLDPVRSIKAKLGILILCSGAIAFAYFRWRLGWLPTWTSITALVIGLVTSQLLAHGMTSPLREMTAAARAMARGDYTRRVRATSRDEVGELAVAFNQMSADLADADRQRRELIANVSHELRTPISALQAVLENLVDGVATPDPATLRTALAQSQRLGRLVTELLDLSRIEAGALSPHFQEFPIAPLVADAVAEAEVNAATTQRGVRFVTDVRPEGLAVHGDRARLHQVLANLLDNAVRHSPSGGEVRVSVSTADAGPVIEVRDQGPGIGTAERHLVFQRFTRGERATGGGTGLGLAIARWVVDMHGGTIEVAEPDTSGCRIRVTLPARSG